MGKPGKDQRDCKRDRRSHRGTFIWEKRRSLRESSRTFSLNLPPSCRVTEVKAEVKTV